MTRCYHILFCKLCSFFFDCCSIIQIQEDDTVPDLLVLPPGADLHKHPLVLNGSVFLQVLNLKIYKRKTYLFLCESPVKNRETSMHEPAL